MVASESDLENLVARWNVGEAEALPALIRHSTQRLAALAHHMLRGYPALRRWVETDDVLQNAYIRLIRALEKVDVESQRHFFALAALQMRRELIDLGRRYFGPAGVAAKHQSRAGDDSQERANVEVADSNGNDLEPWCHLHEQIGLLPVAEREVVDLIFYDGLSQADAARVLDVSVRTIQRRWQSALLMLHEAMADMSIVF